MEKEKIALSVDSQRIIHLLSTQIYDSPFVLLRENTQNAYDALLERRMEEKNENWLEEQGKIEITIDNSSVCVKDNGIGMTEDVLRNNFWCAGASGKNNERSKQAGVIGIFGIGAMANFGQGNSLRVVTRPLNNDIIFENYVRRDEIDINKECITFDKHKAENEDFGTEITITLDSPLNIASAKNYLMSFVEFLPVNVYFNGEFISRKQTDAKLGITGDKYSFKAQGINFMADVSVFFDKKMASAHLVVENIEYNSKKVQGRIAVTVQRGGYVFTTKNKFGLCRIPINSIYQLSGYFDCELFMPTAGRETLTNDSQNHINNIVRVLEDNLTTFVSNSDLADTFPLFLNYISNRRAYNLAQNMTVRISPSQEQIRLKDLNNYDNGLQYYDGSEKKIIDQFATVESPLIVLDTNNHIKKAVQKGYITSYTSIQSVPDKATVIKIFKNSELDSQEFYVLMSLQKIIQGDYLLDIKISCAEISHSVRIMTGKGENGLSLYISRENKQLKDFIDINKTAPNSLDYFLREYIRITVYPLISDYVPSIQKMGRDKINEILAKREEIYIYTSEDQGEFEELYEKMREGILTFKEALPKFDEIQQKKIMQQQVTITSNDVGDMSTEMPAMTSEAATGIYTQAARYSTQQAVHVTAYYNAAEAIKQLDIETNKKLLFVSKALPQFNGYKMFIGVTETVFHKSLKFLDSPHTTRIMWSGHKVIYIFSSADYRQTLYYTITLKDAIPESSNGAGACPTTTILTASNIFIPIPAPIEGFFAIPSGSKELLITHELIER